MLLVVLIVFASFCSANSQVSSAGPPRGPIAGFDGPYSLLWDDRCTLIYDGDYIWGGDCTLLCLQNTSCNVMRLPRELDYPQCSLWQCPYPVPEPTYYEYGWVGYKREGVPVGPIPNFEGPYLFRWSEDQCSYLQTCSANADTCAYKCQIDSNCSAFEHNAIAQNCTMRHCPDPAPEPMEMMDGWVGYKKMGEGKAVAPSFANSTLATHCTIDDQCTAAGQLNCCKGYCCGDLDAVCCQSTSKAFCCNYGKKCCNAGTCCDAKETCCGSTCCPPRTYQCVSGVCQPL